MVSCSAGEIAFSSLFQPCIKRNAFHIFVAKFRPCNIKSSSKRRSFPAAELNKIPTRTPSAPYLSINSIGSGELPRDLDIFRRCLSLTIPVKYTFLNGTCPFHSNPAIIIRATQKKIISGPVTRSAVG